VSKSRPHERHMFPTGELGFVHESSAYCKCRPSRRSDSRFAVFIHNVYSSEGLAMKEPEYRDFDSVFTVVMPEVLHVRFERWLRREHLQMAVAPGSAPNTYVVLSPSAKQH
jgi:hypothetical protein